VADVCRLAGTSAADRLCVAEQLEKMPRLAQALRSGEIGYQASSVICHLGELLADKGETVDPEQWIGYARQFSIKDLRRLAEHARYVVDPDGAERDSEEDYSQRYLHLSPLGRRMYKLDAVLDREAGLALKAALEALTDQLGPSDDRKPRQRRADAFKELVVHALDAGTLPRRHGVRPHISLHATVEGTAELADGMPVSAKTAQRLACDAVMHRVLSAGSLVIDVGRAQRTAQPAQWRALRARHSTCAAPGCERPLGWTQAHHVEFWSRGGETNARKLVPLCYYHHRLVHEGGWQVVLAGERVEFVPPDTPAMLRRRWGEFSWRSAA
jgi:hypothetical protein